jgi:hypothetical protein
MVWDENRCAKAFAIERRDASRLYAHTHNTFFDMFGLYVNTNSLLSAKSEKLNLSQTTSLYSLYFFSISKVSPLHFGE